MKLHMIGNAHLDPVWLWDWREGFQEVKATFRSALDRMREYPEFVFTCSSACYYQWVEDNEPEMFREIAQRVREGRWVVVGGWWIQPDCNTPSGESFARQGLIGQRYFESRFGRKAATAYNVDSFGHAGTLPQIMKLSGLTQYVFMRPMKHEKQLPSNLFSWVGADGSALPAFRIPVGYCTWEPELGRRIQECLRELSPEMDAGMLFYGVGNHGGGPTKQNLNCIGSLQAEGMDLAHSSPDAFFEGLGDARAALPRVTGELLHHSSGCYSAHSGIKKWNRTAENQLIAAEKWCTLSHLALGLNYPGEALSRAWKQVLFNQFHDILAGTSIAPAYEDARNQLGEAISLAEEASNAAMQALAWHVAIEQIDGTRPIVVFNPHAFDARIDVAIQSACLDHLILQDEVGNATPFQRALPAAATCGRETLLFSAQVPALGYRLYRLTPGTAPEQPQPAEDLVLENRFLRAAICRENGLLKSLVRKADGLDLLSGPAGAPVVIADTSDTWSHDVFSFRTEVGRFAPLCVRRTEAGPVRQTVRAEYAWGHSTLVTRFALWADSDQLEMEVTVNWQEREKMLKLEFPVSGDARESQAEAPFGSATRPADGLEYPMQSWAALGALAVINDGKYAYDALDRSMRLTLLRSPRYAHHTPYAPEADADFPFMDQGLQTVRLALAARDSAPSVQIRRGEILNQRAFSLFETGHAGELPAQGSLARLEAQSIHLSALKQAEDASGDLIAHLWESDGVPATGALWLFGARIPVSLSPFEITALRIGLDGQVRKVNLLEE